MPAEASSYPTDSRPGHGPLGPGPLAGVTCLQSARPGHRESGATPPVARTSGSVEVEPQREEVCPKTANKQTVQSGQLTQPNARIVIEQQVRRTVPPATSMQQADPWVRFDVSYVVRGSTVIRDHPEAGVEYPPANRSTARKTTTTPDGLEHGLPRQIPGHAAHRRIRHMAVEPRHSSPLRLVHGAPQSLNAAYRDRSSRQELCRDGTSRQPVSLSGGLLDPS